MSRPGYELDVEIQFEFELGPKKYQGVVGLGEDGKVLFVEIFSKEAMRPIDTEKVLYQVAHLIAEKTNTENQLKEEKLNVWN